MRHTEHATGTFTVELVPGKTELGGQVSRMDFTKRFKGDLDATGKGLMLSAGDPGAGTAGYVAIETVLGQLHGLAGGFALQQYGTVTQGRPTLQYAIVPARARERWN